MHRKRIKRYAVLAAIIMLVVGFAAGSMGRPVATITNLSDFVMHNVSLSTCNGEWSTTWEKLEPGESVACVLGLTQSESDARLTFEKPGGEIVSEAGGYIEGSGGTAMDFRVFEHSKVDISSTEGEWRVRRLMLR